MSTELATQKVVEVPTDDKTNVEIIPFGSDERIKLNIKIVQSMVAVPTRSGKLPDATQAMKFIMLCKARHLNPFEGDAYLIGYDTQSGPQFSLITAHQVFLKRAEASEGFNGMQSGVVVKTSNGIEEREGDLTFEGDELLGGWSKVYRKDREHPFYRRLKLSTFNTGRSRWEKDPAGMIVKCAEADALRSAFPTHLGGLYISEERQPIDVTATSIPIERPKIGPGVITTVEPDKPKRRGRAVKSDAPPATPAATEIERRLKEGDSSVPELLMVLIEHDWVDAPSGWNKTQAGLNDVPLVSIGQEKLDLVLEKWAQVVTWVDEKRNPPPAKSELPFG